MTLVSLVLGADGGGREMYDDAGEPDERGSMGWPESGSYQFVGEESLVKVFTYKVPSKLSAVAHDLELHTRALEGTLEVQGESVQVDVEIGLWNLGVRDGILSRLEKGECKRLLRKKVLKKEADAWARFQGGGTLEGERVALDGTLAIRGSRPRKVSLECTVSGGDNGVVTVLLKHALLQTDYGIKPYSALMGALKLQDEIRVEIEAKVAPRE